MKEQLYRFVSERVSTNPSKTLDEALRENVCVTGHTWVVEVINAFVEEGIPNEWIMDDDGEFYPYHDKELKGPHGVRIRDLSFTIKWFEPISDESAPVEASVFEEEIFW